MSTIAGLASQDREQLFRDSAEVLAHLPPGLIEKDFWVVWCLGFLFRSDCPISFVFKGGTSLSKVYGAIDRFSEDIDLSLGRTDLGFVEDRDPANASSGKQKKQLLKELSEAASQKVQGPLRAHLEATCRDALGEPEGSSWLSLAEDDPQTLLFRYPATGVTPAAADYTMPIVRLEFGARSDPWPSARGTVRPYAVDAFPDEFPQEDREVEVLAVERTFWEKATILHSLFHGGEARVRPFLSRHYYDLARLAPSDYGTRALQSPGLLDEVATHKATFFPAAWARYDEARIGTLRLVPGRDVRAALTDDYDRMREMIFGTPPDFEGILATLEELEASINAA